MPEQFKVGDLVRIVEVWAGDPCPVHDVGDVVTLAFVRPTHSAPPGFYLFDSGDRKGCTYGRLVRVTEEPATDIVDTCERMAEAARLTGESAGEVLLRGHGENTLTSKDTNPKDAVAVAHLKFSSVPMRVLPGIALALSEGAWKYGRHNYRVAGVKASVYFDAVLDHLFAWQEGEDIDPDSGRNHIDKALAGLFVLRDCMLGGNWTDDRPPAVEPGWIAEGHEATKELFERMREKYPEPKAPFVRKP